MTGIKISDVPLYNGVNAADAKFLGTINEAGTSTTYIFDNSVVLNYGINVKFYGATGDGVTNDTAAFVAAIAALNAGNGGMLLVPNGLYACVDLALYLLKPIIIQGEGIGSGYGVPENYIHNTTLLLKGTGEAFIRTRVRHRSSVNDPQDPALSAAITYGSEGCDVRDLTLFLDQDYSNNANNYTRANYSMGIFNQGYSQCRATNVDIYGALSLGSIAINATRATNMVEPLIPSLNVRFPKPTRHKVGVDGITTHNVQAYGARWGGLLLGPKPAPGTSDMTTNYYDQDAGALVGNFRNGIGASDFDSTSCAFYGGDQHNGVRWSDITDPVANETVAQRFARMQADADPFTGSGCFYLSAIEMSKMRFYNTRFSGTAPFRLYMEYVNDVSLYDCHFDFRGYQTDADASYGNRIDVKDTTGVDLKTRYPNGSGLVLSTAASYGSIAGYETTGINIIGGTANPDANYFLYDVDTAMFSNTSGRTQMGALVIRDFASESQLRSSKDLVLKSDLEVDIQSGTLTRIREGTSTLATIGNSLMLLSDLDIEMRASGTKVFGIERGDVDSVIMASTKPELDYRCTSLHRFRHGSVTAMSLSNTTLELVNKVIAFTVGGATIVQLSASGGNALFTSTGEVDIRSGAASLLRFRAGSTTKATISSNGLTLNDTSFTVSGGTISVTYGHVGTPQGVLTANAGSTCTTTAGGFFVKSTAGGNTGWLEK